MKKTKAKKKTKAELKRKLIAAEQLLHSEGFLTHNERSRVWRRFDQAFSNGKWPTALRDLGK